MAWVAVAGLVITTATGYMQNEANNEVAEENAEAAITAQMYDNRQLNEQQREKEEIAADRKLEYRIKAMQAQSTLQAQGRNISGVSVDRRQQDINDALGKALGQLNGNTASQRRQLEMSKKGTSAAAQSRINSVPKTTYNPAADIAQAGLSIYGGFQSSKRASKKADLPEPTFNDYAFGDWK